LKKHQKKEFDFNLKNKFTSCGAAIKDFLKA